MVHLAWLQPAAIFPTLVRCIQISHSRKNHEDYVTSKLSQSSVKSTTFNLNCTAAENTWINPREISVAALLDVAYQGKGHDCQDKNK